MGKVGNFLLIAAAVAVNVIPGAGQFASGAIVGALGGSFTALGIAQTALQIVTIGGLMSGIGLAGQLLGLTPSAPAASKPEASERQVKSSFAPRIYIYGRRRSFGAVACFETATSGAAVDVIAFMDGRSSSVLGVYLNDDLVTVTSGVVQALDDGSYGGENIHISWNSGLATETAFSEVVALLPGIWTSAHRGDGVTSGYMVKKPVPAEDYLAIYPQGDNITLSLALSSWPLFDPRSGTNSWGMPSGWTGYNDNPILGLLHYLVTKRGEDYATRILPAIDYWKDAADICDVSRGLKEGGSERNYRSWIMFDSTAKPSDVIVEFLRACDGLLCENQDGHLLVYAGEFYSPTVSIGSAEIIDYDIAYNQQDEDRINEIIVSYISADNGYNSVEGPAWRDEDDIAERGTVYSTTFAPQVPSHAQAQYLAKRLMAKTNAACSGTIRANFSGRSVMGERYINLKIEEAGAVFFDGIAEITAAERDTSTGGIVFQWVSYDGDDNWDPEEDEGSPAPDPTPVEPGTVDAPDITDAVPVSDGAGGIQIAITATSNGRPDLTWYVRWRLDGDAEWSQIQRDNVPAGSSVTVLSGSTIADANIEVGVRYKQSDGRLSPWSATELVDTSGSSTAPGSPTQVSASAAGAQISVDWRNPASANFSYARVYRGTTPNFSAATAFSGTFPGSPLAYESEMFSPAPGSYYVWVQAFTASDVGSVPARAPNVVVIDPL